MLNSGFRGPGFWMDETTGVLRPAIQKYLRRGELSPAEIATIRAYFRQWIMNPVWDLNPYPSSQVPLKRLRDGIETLISVEAIDKWLYDAMSEGLDPL